jgi:hypothetical protein
LLQDILGMLDGYVLSLRNGGTWHIVLISSSQVKVLTATSVHGHSSAVQCLTAAIASVPKSSLLAKLALKEDACGVMWTPAQHFPPTKSK